MKSYGAPLSQAKKLQAHICSEFSKEKQYRKMVDAVYERKTLEPADYVFVSDFFAGEYAGGAELSLQALIDTCQGSCAKIKSAELDEIVLDFYKDKTWIFGNVARVSDELIQKITNSEISYYVSESDYKYCQHRLPQLCKLFNGGVDCSCSSKPRGALFETFYNNAQALFFRSEKQKKHVKDALNIKTRKIDTLSALFDEGFLKKFQNLKKSIVAKKTNKWVVCGSPSWVKGTVEAENWCKENDKDYVKLHDVSYDEALETLASAEGLCFLPRGYDTCPRLVIEAKLLGCELEINDNVLHADERWFNTKNESAIIKHLKQQPAKFWNTVG